MSSVCIFFVILHRNSLKYDSISASFLYDLTKNLTAYLTYKFYEALPKMECRVDHGIYLLAGKKSIKKQSVGLFCKRERFARERSLMFY